MSVHTEGFFDRAKDYAKDFVEQSNGDIVFQHGPHTWAGVKVYEKSSGGKGVAFHGLGILFITILGITQKTLLEGRCG